jgi:Dna[CI] antecedent, DciA
MRKLSDALSGWAPGDAPVPAEPLLLLQAAWPDIVGAQVAKNSHPARIAAGTLLITTRSSVWSHQLSLLTEHVLQAVSARLPSAEVKQLRFRVGSVPARRDEPPGRRRAVRVRGSLERPPSGSSDEALARFRKEVEQSQRAKRSEGWKACIGCGVLVAPDAADLCPTCSAARVKERGEAVARLLLEAPWLGYAGTAALVSGLREVEYEGVRDQLLSRWWEVLVRVRAAKQLSRDGRERLVASSYVLLKSKIPPEEIKPATVRSILGDELHDLIYT